MSEVELTPYVEHLPEGVCPVCTTRKIDQTALSSTTIFRGCSQCNDMYYDWDHELYSPISSYLRFLKFICDATRMAMDVSGDRLEGETVEHVVLNEEDFEDDWMEVICDLSQNGLFIEHLDKRWVISNFGIDEILLIDLNVRVGFIFEETSGIEEAYNDFKQGRGVMEITPTKKFAHEVDSAILAAHSI